MAIDRNHPYQVKLDEKKFNLLKAYADAHGMDLYRLYIEALTSYFAARHQKQIKKQDHPYFALSTPHPKSVNVYLSTDLFKRVKVVAKADHVSYRSVLFTALCIFIDELDAYFSRIALNTDEALSLLKSNTLDTLEMARAFRAIKGPFTVAELANQVDLLPENAQELKALSSVSDPVWHFAISGYTDDIEGLLALDALYNRDHDAAMEIIFAWDENAALRVGLKKQIKIRQQRTAALQVNAKPLVVTHITIAQDDLIILDTNLGALQLVLSVDTQEQLSHALQSLIS